MNNPVINNQEEWLKILGKGMVTIPKNWRDELGLETGEVMRAKKVGNKVILEAQTQISAPYRIFSDEEIKEWLEADKLPSELKRKLNNKFKSFKSG